MSNTSEFITIIRPSFMSFCKDACRAAAFNHLLFRIAGKAKDQPKEKIQAGDILWYARTEQIVEEMAKAWGTCKVRKEVNAILDIGVIGRRSNPEWGADRTKHFCFGQKECKKFLELCQEHAICIVHLGLPVEMMHLIYLANANDISIKCTCEKHQMEVIHLSNASDESIRAITIDSPPEMTAIDDNKEGVTREGAALADATPAQVDITSYSESDTHSQNGVTQAEPMATGNIIKPVLTLKVKGATSDAVVHAGDDCSVVVGEQPGQLPVAGAAPAPAALPDHPDSALPALAADAQHTPLTASLSPVHDAGQAALSPAIGGPLPTAPAPALSPERGAVQASGGNILSRSGEKPKRGKAAPAPVDLKSEPAEIQRRLNERRGYCLETAGEIIQERKAIKAWCTLHTLEEFETVMDALQQDDPYWKKPDNKHRISGVVLARETPKVLAKQRRDQRPPVPEEIDPYSIDWLRQLQAGRVAQA